MTIAIFRQAGIDQDEEREKDRGPRPGVSSTNAPPPAGAPYVPALPDLAVAGSTRAEVEQPIREGIPLHLEGLVEEGLPIPDPSSVEVQAIAV